MFDNCQFLTNSLCHCPSRYCVQTGVVVCAHAAASRLKERRLLIMSPQGQQLFRSRRAAARASRRNRCSNVLSWAKCGSRVLIATVRSITVSWARQDAGETPHQAVKDLQYSGYTYDGRDRHRGRGRNHVLP
jgi:hypothetical protein